MRLKSYAPLLAVVILAVPAMARDNGQWKNADASTRQWLRDQKSPKTGMSCCNESDGEQVQEDIREGHYWIRGGNFSDWTLVPDDVVLRGPNMHGQPVVWSRVQIVGKPSIYCYAPGAGI